MGRLEFSEVLIMENKKKNQNGGFGEDDGAMKMKFSTPDVSTPAYAALTKQQMGLLDEKIKVREKNIKALTKEEKNNLKNEAPETVLAQ